MNKLADMKKLTDGLPSKSEKIRRLGQAGYSRQQIADFLGIRYQHVRNVLVDAEKKQQMSAGGLSEPKRDWRAEAPAGDRPGKIRVLPDGSAVIPAFVMAAAGFKPGDRVVAHGVGEGDIQLFSGAAAMRYAQEMVRKYIPENVSLLDDLLKERRREAEKEEREFRETYE